MGATPAASGPGADIDGIVEAYPDVSLADCEELCASRGLEQVYDQKLRAEPVLGRKHVQLYADADRGVVVEAHDYTGSDLVQAQVHAELAMDGAYEAAVAELGSLDAHGGIVSHHSPDRAVVDIGPRQDPASTIDALDGLDHWDTASPWRPVRHYFAHAPTAGLTQEHGPVGEIMPSDRTRIEAAGADGDDLVVTPADPSPRDRVYHRLESDLGPYRDAVRDRAWALGRAAAGHAAHAAIDAAIWAVDRWADE